MPPTIPAREKTGPRISPGARIFQMRECRGDLLLGRLVRLLLAIRRLLLALLVVLLAGLLGRLVRRLRLIGSVGKRGDGEREQGSDEQLLHGVTPLGV